MAIKAQSIKIREQSQRRFFMASTGASMLVFAALATMLMSMNSAYRPLPAEDLVRVSVDRSAPVVVGMNTHQQ